MKRPTILVIFIAAALFCGTALLVDRSSSQEREDGFSDRPDLSTTIVISQAYGGGGGSTGTYLHDYVELKNISSTAQSLNGLRLMYGSATGQFGSSTGNIFALPDVSINPGQYYLVQTSAAGSAGAALPVTPDSTTTNLTMSGTNGKIALVTAAFTENSCGGTATPCTLPTPTIVDVVSWGTANNAEGGAPTNGGAALTATQGNVRKTGGCTETDNNNNDFDVVTAPVPRNTATTAALCGGGGPTPTPTATPTGTPTATPTPSATPTPGPLPGALPKRLFTTRLSGAQEVPPVTTNGRGFGRVVLNPTETQITASVYWEGLSSGTVSGHIHGPAAVGANAGVLFNLNPTTGVTSGSVIDATFNVTAQQVADLRAGLWYFNIHTSNNTGGEIRGQISSSTNDAPLDFNGDGRTDFSVVRPTAGLGGTQIRWFNQINAPNGAESQIDFGVVTDSITPGDFDGDGKDDIAIWRSETNNSRFFILQSSTNTVRQVRFGIPADNPFVIGDYDGDGKDDPAIYRKADTDAGQSQFWWFGSYGVTKDVQVVVNWGVGGDSSVPGDYNGDGKADFFVYRQVGTRGVAFIHYGTGGFDSASANDSQIRFGLPTDTFVPGDWDGDGATDLSVTRFEGAAIAWYNLPSSNPTVIRRLAWGRNGPDLEVQGDYDGDGKTDHAIWRSTSGQTSIFHILRSSDSTVQYQFWGLFGDALTGQDTHNQ